MGTLVAPVGRMRVLAVVLLAVTISACEADSPAGPAPVATVTADTPSKPPATNPAIIVGDAPWNPGHEVPNAIIRGFQYYDVQLTPSEIAQEIAAPGSVRRPWYLNLNPTPSDISDKSGNGHHPGWVGPGRPTLWTSISPYP